MVTGEIVVLNHEYADLELERRTLQPLGLCVREAKCTNERETIDACRNAIGIICVYASLSEVVIDSLNQCRVIARPGVGYEGICISAAVRRGIRVTYVPDYCTDEVADHTLALLLAVQRKIVPYSDAVRRGIWDYKLGRPITRLKDKTIGVIGLGRIGQQTVRRLKGFGVEIIGHDPFVADEVFQELNVHCAPLDQLLGRSDIITLHCSSSPQTRHMICRQTISLMAKCPILINTSRGSLVCLEDLSCALRDGQIAGAGLDVLEDEPRIPQALVDLPNVVVTPHAAWFSIENEKRVRSSALDEVVRAICGNPPGNLVPEALKVTC